MNNVLTPTIGTNGYIKKFDGEAKSKSKFKQKVKRVVRITKIAYLLVTLLGTIWGIRLTQQTYMLRCQVNLHTIGYFSRRAECDSANQAWIDSQTKSVEIHQSEMLANNPDLN